MHGTVKIVNSNEFVATVGAVLGRNQLFIGIDYLLAGGFIVSVTQSGEEIRESIKY